MPMTPGRAQRLKNQMASETDRANQLSLAREQLIIMRDQLIIQRDQFREQRDQFRDRREALVNGITAVLDDTVLNDADKLIQIRMFIDGTR